MSGKSATRKDHEAFCETEGWMRVRDARGRTGTHHVTYELDLPGGGVLRTRISHPADRTDYGPALWSHILHDQLQVTASEFWACVHEGTRPDRGVPEIPQTALPADVVHLLITRVGLAEADVAAMDKREALARLQRYWSESG